MNERERSDLIIDIVCMIDGRERQRQYNAEELPQSNYIAAL